MTLNSPSPEQFGLTQERINYFEKTAEAGGAIIIIAVVVNFLICLLFDFLFPKIHIPFLLFLFLAIYPGFVIGVKIDEHRIAKIKNLPDYLNYLTYKDALKAYNKLYRKLKRDDAKKRRKIEQNNRKKEEWWRGIDGRCFELEVAKILMNKNYIVKHTGSSYGDKGIDLILKIENKTIIIQCKAFKNYISAGYIRELYGTLIHEKADEAWLIATSGFYSGAKAFAYDKPIRLLTIRDLIKLPPNELLPRMRG
jgi:hypothetical protein